MTEFPGPEPRGPNVPPGPLPYPGPYPDGPYPPAPYPLQYQGFPPAPPRSTNGLAVASLTLGIVGLFTTTLFIGFALGIAAVVTGVSARGRARREGTHEGGMAVAGIVLGVIATVVGLVFCAILAFLLSSDWFNETYQHCLGEHNGMSEYCEQYR